MYYLTAAFELRCKAGYLVDLVGQLVPVQAVDFEDARQLALLAQGSEISADLPVAIYRLDENGKIIEEIAA